jgi:hypothetical protein
MTAGSARSAIDPGCVKTRIVVDDTESYFARGPEGIQLCCARGWDCPSEEQRSSRFVRERVFTQPGPQADIPVSWWQSSTPRSVASEDKT